MTKKHSQKKCSVPVTWQQESVSYKKKSGFVSNFVTPLCLTLNCFVSVRASSILCAFLEKREVTGKEHVG